MRHLKLLFILYFITGLAFGTHSIFTSHGLVSNSGVVQYIVADDVMLISGTQAFDTTILGSPALVNNPVITPASTVVINGETFTYNSHVGYVIVPRNNTITISGNVYTPGTYLNISTGAIISEMLFIIVFTTVLFFAYRGISRGTEWAPMKQ